MDLIQRAFSAFKMAIDIHLAAPPISARVLAALVDATWISQEVAITVHYGLFAWTPVLPAPTLDTPLSQPVRPLPEVALAQSGHRHSFEQPDKEHRETDGLRIQRHHWVQHFTGHIGEQADQR